MKKHEIDELLNEQNEMRKGKLNENATAMRRNAY